MRVQSTKSSTPTLKIRTGAGFILASTLIFLMILSLVSGALFNQIIQSQQQGNLAISHIRLLNAQQHVANQAKNFAWDLIANEQNLTVPASGFCPFALKDTQAMNEWKSASDASVVGSEHWRYRLVYTGEVQTSANSSMHTFTLQQINLDWQSVTPKEQLLKIIETTPSNE
ncbi:hypothetical protein [Thalassotalea mangrovi]|uniref:Type 4 fimbrial biogenesis protein PilX N-terminal domain-containing protein n=1 Tax=Thalassotalea mangrovi TaxID=2572245 RepID=A0A4U1B3U6_9GAMM|nr:hypothetical protein [Thalassotalea mangrovi]TKB44250.1 hypothetical protein E8M12_12620 [Thalassotalea mangrovi]